MFYAPTGAGKGFMLGYLVQQDLSRRRKVLVLSSRTEIMKQNLRYLSNFGNTAAFVSPRQRSLPEESAVVAMTQTLKRRVEKSEWQEWLRTFDMVYIDEAQECVSDFIHPLLREDCCVVGLSGSPHRYGNMYQLGHMYKAMVSSVTVRDLIDMGFLAKPHLYSISAPSLEGVVFGQKGDYNQKSLASRFENPRLYEGVVNEYLRLTPQKKAICFCVSSKQAIAVTKEFNRKGVTAKYVLSGSFDDDTAYTDERSEVIDQFIRGEFTVLVNVGVLIAGFDCPDIEVVICNYATISVVKWRQSLGRGARTTPTKKEFYILDCGANYKRLGRYEDEHTNCLWHDVSAKGDSLNLKQCDETKPDINGKKGCGQFVPMSCKVCPACGRVFVAEKHEAIMHLEEIADGDTQNDIVAWAAAKYQRENWKLPRIMIQACLANPDNMKKAFFAIYKGLFPHKTLKECYGYWYQFMKLYGKNLKRNG